MYLWGRYLTSLWFNCMLINVQLHQRLVKNLPHYNISRYNGGKEDQDTPIQWGEAKLAHVVKKVLMKDHLPRMQRYSSRRQWDKLRRQRPSWRAKYDSLIRPSIVNVRHSLILNSRHGNISWPSSRFLQNIIKETQGEIWVYLPIFPLWNKVGIWVNED